MKIDLFDIKKTTPNLTIKISHLISGQVDATRWPKLTGGFPPLPPALTEAMHVWQIDTEMGWGEPFKIHHAVSRFQTSIARNIRKGRGRLPLAPLAPLPLSMQAFDSPALVFHINSAALRQLL